MRIPMWNYKTTADTNIEPQSIGTVICENVHIYLYTEITTVAAQQFQTCLRQASENARAYLDELDTAPPIHVHLQTPGGDVFAGLSIADAITGCKYEIHTHVEGYCASAGTIISVVGKRRTITPNSYMLFHELSTWFSGKFSELQDEMKMLGNLDGRLTDYYVKHSSMDESAVREMLGRESWFDADECLERGFVDEIS